MILRRMRGFEGKKKGFEGKKKDFEGKKRGFEGKKREYERVAETMEEEAHSGDARVQEHGCGALRSLSANNDANKRRTIVQSMSGCEKTPNV